MNDSEDLDLTCDAESGKCHCRCDVDGDKCDACVAGHHTFPDCHGKFDFKKDDVPLFINKRFALNEMFQ